MIPMPWNLITKSMYMEHFPSPQSFKLVNLIINAPILLYPIKADNIIGYSLLVNSLVFTQRRLVLGSMSLLTPIVSLLSSDPLRVWTCSDAAKSLPAFPSFFMVYSTKFCCLICHAFKAQSYACPQLKIKNPSTCPLLSQLVAEFCPKSKLLPFYPHQCHPMKILFFFSC